MSARPSAASGTPLSRLASPASTDQPCQFLDWDSQFFERRIARLGGNTLTSEQAAAAVEWCRIHQIDCLYFLAASDHPPTIRAAEALAFHQVDVRIMFERSLETLPPPPDSIRTAEPSDLSALKRIAAHSFSGTRFYNDPHFAKERCDELYITWTEKSLDGFADRVLVVDHDGIAAGYISCSLHPSPHGRDESIGSIGLVAVDSAHRGSGVGQRLVDGALHYFAGQGMALANVVTQGSNLKSQRLYQRCGFITQSLQFWYHRWFSASDREN